VKKKREKRRSAPASDSPEGPTDPEREPLAQRFTRFASEAEAYASPLYAQLSRQIAADPDLLGVASHVRRPPIPNVFFAAVHFLLAAAPSQHALSAFYGSLHDHPRPASDAGPAFREFVLSHTADLIPLLETRITQTNEVSRCAFLLPAFTTVHRSTGRRPLALIDIGCSAGLHLLWDRYYYDYGVARVGDPRAPVRIACELRGDVLPPLPEHFPVCTVRIGIDLNPIDLTDPVERRWFDALIWPEHANRRALAAAAIDELLRDRPTIVKGDAVDVLESQLHIVPPDTALIVYNSAALCQGGAADETAIAAILGAWSSRRPIHWLHCEGEEVVLRDVQNGVVAETKLANKDGHGRWLEWLACIAVIALVAVMSAAPLHAQTIEWGVKAGVESTAVASVPEYYDWFLCCNLLNRGAMVESTARRGFVGGVFIAAPIAGWVALQGDVMFAQRRHFVDLQPFENNQVTFERDYVDTAGLVRLTLPVRGEHRVYVAGGPVVSFRIGEGSRSKEPGLRRGDRDIDVYVMQVLAYGAPELLRRSHASVAVVGGWTYRRLLVEARFTQGVQSIFRNRQELVAGFVSVGGHEPTLRQLISEFAPFMEAAKSRDVAVLAGFRF
jgi:hypothetical protein